MIKQHISYVSRKSKFWHLASFELFKARRSEITLFHRHNQKVTTVYQRWPCPLSQFLNKPRIRTQNLMKKAVPPTPILYPLELHAGQAFAHPFHQEKKSHFLTLSHVTHLWETLISFFPINSQTNWAGKDMRWICSDMKSGNADSHKALTLSIKYSKRLMCPIW